MPRATSLHYINITTAIRCHCSCNISFSNYIATISSIHKYTSICRATESRNTDASLSKDESLNVGMLWRSQMASELDLQVKQKQTVKMIVIVFRS